MKKLFLWPVVIILYLAQPNLMTAQTNVITPGSDLYIAPMSEFYFGPGEDLPELPADFFGPGSDPFHDSIPFTTNIFSGYSVEIERLNSGNVPPPYPSNTTLDIKFNYLELYSPPVLVTSNGGNDTTWWYVILTLSAIPAPNGIMEVTKDSMLGGTFFYDPLYFHPRFRFIEKTNPFNQRMYDNALEGNPPLVFDSEPYHWFHGFNGYFYAFDMKMLILESTSHSSFIGLFPDFFKMDHFYAEWDGQGDLISGGGSGDPEQWYYYPNTDWWNKWFYDHPFDPTRAKLIFVHIPVHATQPSANATVVLNWSTPEWSLQNPTPPDPPLPPLTPEEEELYIKRSIPLFDGPITDSVSIDTILIIPAYNPEWISVDIRGENIIIPQDTFSILDPTFSFNTGFIAHICLPNFGIIKGEFGDAPEKSMAYRFPRTMGMFPTCWDWDTTTFFVAHIATNAFFGPSADIEPDGNAGWCPVFYPGIYDKDERFNDGDAGLLFPGPFTYVGTYMHEVAIPCAQTGCIDSICGTATWGTDIDITVTNNTQDISYVNVLVDWNQDGVWAFDPSTQCNGLPVPEQVLEDFPVPPGFSGPISALNPPSFTLGPNNGLVWVRFTVTEVETGNNWHGEGLFMDGETEDYLLFVGPLPKVPLSNYAVLLLFTLMFVSIIFFRRKG